jgi:HK97 family phage prohead protease
MPERGKGGYAYATLNIKNIDNEQRIIEGVASTPTPDRVGDIVEPLGAKFTLPMPLLWQHNSREPIGHVTWAEAREDGIPFRARIAKATEPGKLLDRLDEAWQSIKLGLVAAVSIGFKGIDVEDIDPKKPWGPQRFKAWEWIELSAVTIPANTEANIVNIRSIDQALRAAPGNEQTLIDPPPASGKTSKPAGASARSIKLERVKTMPMTNAERMKGLEEKRAAEMAALESIQSKITDENRTKDESEQEAFDGHATTIKSLARELSDCRMIERELINKAKPPAVIDQNGTAIEMHQPVIQVTAPKLDPGIGLMKMLHCQAYARENHRDVIAVAREHCGQWPQIEQALRSKAAVALGNTTSATWASPLVYAQNLASEFVNFLVPMTFFGKIQGLTRVPFNSRVVRDTATISAQWVGEGESKPAAAGAFDTVTLTFNKIALIIGVTQELARFSSPAVETWARDKLAESIAKFQDEQFINPAITAITGSRPAAITNGADSDAASGTAATDLLHDIRQIIKHFQDFNIPTNQLVLLMQPQLATAIGSIYTTLGIQQFPQINGDGGSVTGIQVITSGNVPAGYVVALHPPSIAVADDAGIDISASSEASVEMDDNPTAGNYHLVSAFQNNLLFVRAERFVTWKRLRDKGVFYLTNAAYGGAVT